MQVLGSRLSSPLSFGDVSGVSGTGIALETVSLEEFSKSEISESVVEPASLS